MSNEELAERIRDGDESLIPQLWEQVRRFIVMHAVRYMKAYLKSGRTPSFEIGDLVDEAYFAMLAAIDYFHSEKHSFLYTLFLCCKSSFADAAGCRLPRQRHDALNIAISIDDPRGEKDDCSLVDIIPDNGPAVEDVITEALYQQQLHDTLDRAMADLTSRQEEILRRRYYRGETQDRIASDLGCASTAIGKCEQTALRRLYNARALNGLSEFLETHTNYYSYVGLTHFKDTGESAVETIAIRRENLAKSWLAARRSKGDSNDEA